MRIIGKAFLDFFGKNREGSGLTRMFEVEFNKEYRHMKKYGFVIDDEFVKSFLESRT